MVKSCCAYACNEKFIKGGPLTFHRFPKDQERRNIWEKNIRREHFKVTNNTLICSKHFKAECFDETKFGGTWLKSDAVPTIFEIPQYLQIKTSKRRVLNRSNEGISLKPCKRLKYVGDFNEDDLVSPTKAKFALTVAKEALDKKSKRIKNLHQKERRMKKKMKTLKEVVDYLKQEEFISNHTREVLELSIPTSDNSAKLFKQLQKKQVIYEGEIKSFALTLNFFSSKAYDFVREALSLNLPHPSTLRRWFQSVDGDPGFSNVAIEALKVKTNESESKVICSLIIDEMAIRRQIEFDGKRLYGFVDLGTQIDSDQLPEATEAYVFLLNCMNGKWKLPIGYFLIAGLDAPERASMVKKALELIHDTGIDVVSLTFDGPSTNTAMARELGCIFEAETIKSHFPHPVTQKEIVVIYDPSHMIKLVRNCLASKGSIFDDQNRMVKWDFIIKLHELQKMEGLHLANKLQTRHIQWQRERMKVKLATQVFSKSVADALLYLKNSLQHPDFVGCEGTVDFITLFDSLFDIFNSKNLLAKGFKSPLSKNNKENIFKFLCDAEIYIRGLKVSRNGTSVLNSNRRTGFFGFLVCIQSLKLLYINLIESSTLKFIMTYKFSQDHLEMLFSMIRSKGGFNNNPTAKQFQAAYKRILLRNQIKSSISGNCLPLDGTFILDITQYKNKFISKINDMVKPFDELNEDTCSPLEDMPADLKGLSFYVSDIVSYIAGFICRKLAKTLKCAVCVSAMVNNPSFSDLIEQKFRGGLVYPGIETEKLCKEGERKLRYFEHQNWLKRKNIIQKLIVHTLTDIEQTGSLFHSLSDHIFEQEVLHDHRTLLMKSILHEFFRIRLNHIAKSITSNLQKSKNRSQNTKLVLFKGH